MTPLLADYDEALRALRSTGLWWGAIGVLLVVLTGVAIWVRTRFREDSDPAAASGEMLLLAREMRRRGDLSDEEYRSIKGRLLEQREGEISANSEASDGPDPSE